MASDLKIEIFAFNTFHNLWYTYEVTQILPDVLEIYEDECNKEDDFNEALEILFDPVIFVRRSLFKNIYRRVINDEIIEHLKAPLDCYYYVLRICDSDEFFGHLTVFQRMFATITFVLILCLHMYDMGHNIDIVKYGHLFWVMYFDKFTEEFYEKGGWKTLQIEAKPYEYIFDFDHSFNECIFNLQKTKQATVNYFLFKDAVKCKEWKQKHPACFSKLWIKFRIANFESYVNIPLSYEIYMNSFEVEILLEELKLILVHSRPTSSDVRIKKEHQTSTIPTTIPLTELNNVNKEIQANYIRVQAITNEQNRIIKKVFELFSIESDTEKKTDTKSALCEQEQLNLAITNKERNFEFEKVSLTETELSQQTISVDSTKNSTTEQDILPIAYRSKKSDTNNKDLTNDGDSDHSCGSESFINKCEGDKTDNVNKANIKTQDNIVVAGQLISSNKMDENISLEKISREEQLNIAITSKERNFEFEKVSITKTELLQQTISVDSTKNSNIEQDILPTVYRSQKADTNNIDSTNDGDSDHSRGSESFLNKCEGDKTDNLNKANMKAQDNIAVSGQISTNSMGENNSPEKKSSQTDSSPVSEYFSSDDKKKQTIKTQKDFRNEQKDPVMKFFLKMILVLGDQEATKSVISKLPINDGGTENKQESSKKKKKRSKKKSGK